MLTKAKQKQYDADKLVVMTTSRLDQTVAAVFPRATRSFSLSLSSITYILGSVGERSKGESSFSTGFSPSLDFTTFCLRLLLICRVGLLSPKANKQTNPQVVRQRNESSGKLWTRYNS